MLSPKLIEDLKAYVADKGRGRRVERKLAKAWPQESGGGAGRKFDVAEDTLRELSAAEVEDSAFDAAESGYMGFASHAAPSGAARQANKTAMPSYAAPTGAAGKGSTKSKLEAYIDQRRKPAFSTRLMALIDRKGLVDSEVYKKAGIDRRHFSKMRAASYHPSKNTVLALCLALELNLDEAKDLLGSAGYTLSNSDLSDLVLSFCFERRIFDLFDVNQALASFDLKPLGVLA